MNDPPKSNRLQRIYSSLWQDIDTKSHALEVQLCMLSLAIGIQDAVSVVDFHCFASNQTGNTVLLAIGLLQPTSNTSNGISANEFPLLTTIVSLCFFILGVLSSGQIANALRAPNKRWWLLGSSIVQTALVFTVAGLQFAYLDARTDSTTIGRVTLGILAFSSGIQVAMVRAMKISDITTAMATAAYIDLFIDPKLTGGPKTNRGRNRRIAFLFSLVAGTFVGAAIARKAGSPVAVVISGVLKAIVASSFFWNQAEHREIRRTEHGEELKTESQGTVMPCDV
jgi:uncharacterized membrane protein YoaK (UPF0700 family)